MYLSNQEVVLTTPSCVILVLSPIVLFVLALLNRHPVADREGETIPFHSLSRGNRGYKDAGFNGCKAIMPTHAKGLIGVSKSVLTCLSVSEVVKMDLPGSH